MNKITNEEKRRVEDSWHLKKEFPIALIVALLVQTSSIVWYGGKLEQRVINLEAQAVSYCTNAKYDAFEQLLNEREFHDEARFDDIQDDVSEIKKAVADVRRLILSMHLERPQSTEVGVKPIQ